MSVDKTLSASLLTQIIFLSMVIASSGIMRMLFFGLFWIATITTLLIILNRKYWDATEWVVFSSFSAATVTAVLLSSKAIHDVIGVTVPVIGLLIVATLLSLIPKKKAVVKTMQYFTIPTSDKYHQKQCRFIKNRKDTKGHASKEAVLKQGKKPCSLCN